MSGEQRREWLIQTLLRWKESPRLFVIEAFGVEPEPWQNEALDALPTHDRIAIRAGHGVGKTAFIAWVVIWFLLFHQPCKVPVTANSQDQLRDVTWAEIAHWARRLPEWLRDKIEVTAERVMLREAPEDAFAVARTASKDRPEAMQGFHSKNLLFVVEEASGIPDIVFEVAMGALSTEGAKVILVGNPTRTSGYFYDAFHTLRGRFYQMRVNAEDVPRATGHIEDVIAKYGKDSNAYRIRVLGEFPTTEDEQVIPLEWVEAALKRDVEESLTLRPVWGVDVARFGNDRTALAKRRGNVLLEPIQWWRGKDTMQVAGLILNEWHETEELDRPSEILVDVIGIGAGVVDRCNELGLPVRGINVGERPSSADRFMRFRDELWFRGRDWFGARDCKIPDDPELIAELVAPLYTFTSSGKICVESKDEMKERGMKSPDLADAFLLTLAGGLDRVDQPKPMRYRGRRAGRGISHMAA